MPRLVSALYALAARLITDGKHTVSTVTGDQRTLGATYRGCGQTALHVVQRRLAQYRAARRQVQDIVYNLFGGSNACRVLSGTRLGIRHARASQEVRQRQLYDSITCKVHCRKQAYSAPAAG